MLFIQSAYAQAAPAPAQGSGAFNIILMVVIFAIIWFLMIRPQQKRVKEHRAMVSALKRGDEVLTNGGLMGRIVALNEYAIDLEIAKGTVVRMQRPFVTQVLPKGSLKADLSAKNEEVDEKTDASQEENEEKK